ncbi:transport protein [Levilactobacillus senmaizukei DSM 21775 = NBRC 103853]|uniref:Transport protein n=1 Tax=Levilactobacillus senmaizukei DSM 21775 = NBRC 103853 TaxID=1423803 RepID=A0A0R2DPT9_9LACO|nr:MFS transporter [Levilactobacillus senmaizukei]KRN02791.1 transport protein [Levilactobacillus senmaizukei DSM 21775 = NBRC 103853]
MPDSKRRWFLIGMMLIAANLRLPITIIPPLLPAIEHDLGLPSSMAGLITSIPLVTFAICSPIIVKIAQRWGNELTVFVLFTLLVIGSYVRIIPTTLALFLGTFLVGIGIDSGNVLVPALIKDHLPTQLRLGMSLYTLSMLLVGAIGTAVAGLLISHTSFAVTQGLLATIGIIALVAWIPNLRANQRDTAPGHPLERPHYHSVWTQRQGWRITLFFGLQSLVYYAIITWLPAILTTHGVSTIAASNLLTLLQLSGLPLSFMVPLLYGRRHGVTILLSVMSLGYVVAPLSLLIPTQSLVLLTITALIIGFGSGAAFNLAILFFTEKTTNPYQTAAVSGMAQSAGYLLAAFGPLVFGFIHGFTQSWVLVLGIMAACAVALTATGVLIQRHGSIVE